MATAIELREQYIELVQKGNALYERSKGEGLTDDEAREFDAIAAAAGEAKSKWESAEQRERQAAELAKAQESFGRSAGRATSAVKVERARQINPADFGRRFIESDAFKQSRDGITTARNAVELGSFDVRSLVHSGELAEDMLQPQVLAGIMRDMDAPLRIRNVILNATTNTDAITWILEDTWDNQAEEVAEATAVDEGEKPESALSFTQESTGVSTIAHWIPVTRQVLADSAQLASYINNRLIAGLKQREDGQLLNGNGSAPNLRGLLQTSGIQDLDDTYFGANGVSDEGEVNEILNRIRRAITKINVDGGGAVASFVVMNPADAEQIATYTDSTRQYMAGSPFAGGGNVARIWGLPIVESQAITAGTALVGDGSMASVFDRMGATIYTSDSHSDFFIRNLIVVLAEERLALAVFRPAAFAKVKLAML